MAHRLTPLAHPTPLAHVSRECGEPWPGELGRRCGVALGGSAAPCGDYALPPYNWRPDRGYCVPCWICPGRNEGRRSEYDPRHN